MWLQTHKDTILGYLHDGYSLDRRKKIAPPNRITVDCEEITPDLVPLVKLSQAEIDTIVASVEGGVGNVQDIYPLAPLQEGILFHHLMAKDGDPYLLWSLLSFADKARLEAYVAALNAVIGRHDVLRTAVLWEGLPEPVQVVWRTARLQVEEVVLGAGAGDVAERLKAFCDPRQRRIRLDTAPLMRLFVARDEVNDRWVGVMLSHHLSSDHTTLELMFEEVQAHLSGDVAHLSTPQPFRNFVAQARLGISKEEHETFFRDMLGEVDEPTAPFGLMDVQGDGSNVAEASLELDAALCARLRERARQLGVSVASLFHVAWGQVLAKTSAREDAVFGTVLFGRMQGGEAADEVLGLFINTLPIRIELKDVGVEQCVRRTHALLAGLLRHEHASLALAQRCSGVPAPAPLFTSLLNYRHSSAAAMAKEAAPAWEGIEYLTGEERTNYPFAISVDDLGSGFQLTAQTQEPVGPARVCAMMERVLVQLAELLDHSPLSRVGRIDVLSTEERHQQLVSWNATEAEFPRELCVHQLFEAQVRRDPEAVALVHEERSLSYGELNRRANRLAHHLRERGVRPDSRVAICVERSLDMVVGLLGIMKAGGAYVPLDPAYPSDRLAFMLADSAPVLALTHGAAQAALQRAMAGLEVAVVDLDRDQALWAYGPEHDLEPAELGLTSSNLAYVIYTSGSTGTPKGVMVEHESAVNLVLSVHSALGFVSTDLVLQFSSVSFDAALEDMVAPLCCGASVCLLLAQEPGAHAGEVVAVTRRHGVSFWDLPTSFALQLFSGPGFCVPDSVRALAVGGDALPVAGLKFLQRARPSLQILNGYGPTETTVISTAGDLSKASVVHIGRPISNTRIYLLDGLLEPVPVGVAGEIYIGGAGVARGYLNRPELTAERFIASPFVEGDRLYKTGDLGRYLADGNIEFLGRNDFQVKIRGFRIELGEIETQLAQHAGVREAVVLAREREDEPGDKRLAAYYTAADPADAPDAEALRRHLSARLPEHMVPAAYVLIEALPLTPNGKLDRKALPAPDAQALVSRAYEAPRGEVETALAGIWAEVLRLERVGRNDNFFELGGHSLLAVKMLSKVRQLFDVDLALAALFAEPTLKGLTQRVADASRDTLPPISVADRSAPLQLSFAQQRLWFLSQLEGVSEAYHIPLALRLRGELDERALRSALDRLVARHEALRTSFVSIDGEAFQRVEPAEVGFHLAAHDIGVAEDAAAALGELIAAEAAAPFDLERGPLVRGRLVKVGVDEHVLLLTMHHIVSDGWSMGVFTRELNALYDAYSRGEPDLLAPLPVQYADYSAWQRRVLSGSHLADQSAYWLEQLSGSPVVLDLPTDHKRPLQQDFAGDFVEFGLDRTLTRQLKALSQRCGATLFMTVLAGWATVLSRLANQTELVIGAPSANRTRVEVEGLIGFFVNTLALRVDLSGAPSAEELIGRIRTLTVGAQKNQDLPFEQVVELLRPTRSLAHSPIFQVMFAWENNEQADLDLRGLTAEAISVPGQTSKFDLTLFLSEHDGQIVGGLEFATALFRRETVERFAGYLRTVLSEMASDGSRQVAKLPILSTEERHQQLVSWNATEAEFPRELCVHQLFEAQVRRDPEAVALVHEERSLSYGELNRRANRLAHHLRERGVRPDSRVAICVERSLDMVVGLLGIMKAGGAYVPLDPAYPSDRLAFMLADSAPVLALTHGAAQAALQRAMAGLEVAVVDLDRDQALWAYGPEHDLEPAELGLTSSNLAYVIYTSGSTGTPKGVAMPHISLVNLLTWHKEFDGSPVKVALVPLSSFSFDVLFQELFSTLSTGGWLAIRGADHRDDLHFAAQSAGAGKSTCQFLATALLGGFLGDLFASTDDTVPKLEIQVAGQQLNITEDIRQAFERAPSLTLRNNYGPTETHLCTTISLSHSQISRLPQPPIGRPISNTRIYLLDGLLEPVPVGVAGEIYIGGAGVARGYLNRPELTAERFIASPFVEGDRLYKTGDLGRYLADGNIEFLGRNDFQVKIRGFRIELGEIETQLAQHAGVREAVVLAREDEPGDKRLAAYYTAADPADAPDAEALRRHLSARLPEHMVPAAYVLIEALPLTPNGKLDRKALPAPDAQALVSRAYEAPRGEVETALAGIWAEVLRLERVGRNDNFFELGGHSLLAVKMLSKVRQLFDVDLALAALFAEPTLKGLTQRVADASRDTLPPISVADRSAPLQLSFAQQRLWFLSQLEGVSEAYHIPLALRLRGELDERALRSALDRLVARHEALRTSFVSIDGEAFQRVEPAEVGFHLAAHDIGVAEDAAAALGELIAAEAAALFDLERGPLVRGRLVKVGVDEHVLLLTMHHIVSDGWSMGVFTRELNALYDAYSRGEPDLLAPLPVQYADYSAWQRRVLSGSHLADQSAYWLEQLSGSPVVLDLPTDHKRPLQQDFAGDFVEFGLDRTLTRQLKALSQRCGATLFMTVLAGWATVLSRLANQTELVIGAPSANRTRVEVEGLIGFFVNTLALRVDLSGAPSAEELIGRIRTLTVGAQKNQDLPFEQVVELLRPTRSLAHSPIFQVMFAWENNEQADLDLRGLTAEAISVPGQTSKFDLTLFLSEHDGQIVGGLEFATALFRRETVERFAGYLRTVLSEMASDGSRQVAKLPILSTEERHQQLVSWNATEAEFPRELCVHQLFEAQVRRDPEAVALVHEERSLSYGELNRRANRLAHHLRERGVRPDSRVAICVERSLDMVVGLLGIMKAGGAYVPLDPAYPSDRLAFMLADSAPVLALTHGAAQAALQRAMAGLEVAVVDLDRDQALWAYGPEHDLEPAELGLTSSNLAYVIYTSGSTGTPKGVMVEHGNLNRLIAAVGVEVDFGPGDIWSLAHSISFDFSVWEIWGALTTGGGVVILGYSTTRSPEQFWECLANARVSVLNQTPSSFASLTSANLTAEPLSDLRCVIFGGEALEASALNAWRLRNDMRARLVNMYGITEATVHATFASVTEDGRDHKGSVIGRPLADVRIYLLDGLLEPVPVGVAGEIYIGGAGVARGYLNRPELTAERFIASPFVEGDRLYKTGDLGRYLADGNIEFLGRNDFQVKIRGFRIELGEIETQLAQHAGVREAVVLAREREDEPGDKRLAAYYTAADPADAPDAEALRRHLSARLPEHMVPAAYVLIEALPLTPNGKLDRKALPAPDAQALVSRAYEAPRGEVETALAGIWAEVLRLERVGRNDNFFELGGHSLLAVKVLERMRRAGFEADVRALFQAKTINHFAQNVTRGKREETEPNDTDARHWYSLADKELCASALDCTIADIQDVYPLTPLQSGFLFHHIITMGGEDPYVVSQKLEFPDDDVYERFLSALKTVVQRHDILRSAYLWKELDEPCQVVLRRAELRIEELDSAEAVDQDFLDKQAEPYARNWDIKLAPMMRLIAVRDPETRIMRVNWLMHHIIDDNTSLRIILREVAILMETPTQHLPLPVKFRTHIQRLERKSEGADDFFRDMFGSYTRPTSFFGDLNTTAGPEKVEEAKFNLGEGLAQRLRLVAKSFQVTVATLIHSAFGQVAAFASHADEAAIGTILFGRACGGPKIEEAVGLYINTLPLRLTYGDTTCRARLIQAQGFLTRLLEYEHFPLWQVRAATRLPAGAPIFTAIINYRHATSDDVVIPGEYWSRVRPIGSRETTSYPLALFVDDLGNDLVLTVQVRMPISPLIIGQAILSSVANLVNGLEADPDSPPEGIMLEPASGKVPDQISSRLAGRGNFINSWIQLPDNLANIITKIWSEILGEAVISPGTNFFELGGNSIQAMRAVSMLERHGVIITLRQFMDASSAFEVARWSTIRKPY